MLERYIIIFVLGLIVGAVILWFMLSKHKHTALSLKESLNNLQIKFDSTSDFISKLRAELDQVREQSSTHQALASSLKATNNHLNEKVTLQKDELSKSQDRLKLEFENLSNKLLEKNSKKLSEQSKQDLDTILKPFREKISSFEQKVENKHIQDAKDRSQLIQEIKQLSELNKTMQKEANNLTTALKGDSKQQGNWGEMILERVMDSSGLVKGSEYYTQYSTVSEDGKRQQPDIVVNLPGDKHVIIDSKVSLKAYEASVSTEDKDESAIFVKKHIISIKNHIRELSDKNYQRAIGIDSPDFVLMFMPIEASFSMAVREDIGIYDFAWNRKIVIVSPSTLLATLRVIASLWKQEKQNKNALEIASQAGALYDKFVGFTEDLIKVGNQLDNTTKVYRDSMNKLTEGKGNLVRRAEKIKTLGVKTSKSINEKLKDRALTIEDELNRQI